MEVLPPGDRQNLKCLLDAFGSVVSLEDIATAYCQSGRDLLAAGEILCNLQISPPKASSSTPEEDMESVNISSECQSEISETSQFIKSKSRNCPASIGSVSGVIGRDYIRSRPPTNESLKPKPLKLNSSDIPVTAIWDEKVLPDSRSRTEPMHRELEEFLFKMLGDGFSLEMSIIQDIAGQCGYDMKKSMEKLLDLSASKELVKSDDILKSSCEKYPNLEPKQYDSQFPCTGTSGSSKCTAKTEQVSEFPNVKDEKYTLQKELLNALFSVSERAEDPEKFHPKNEVRRSRRYGNLVEEPLKEVMIDHRPVITRKHVTENSDKENEDTYEVLRRAVKEYWITMKEYYKAAFDAFCKQDHERAHKLLEEGHFFMKKAREADEKSAQMLLARNDEEEMVVDVNDFDPKETVRFLKVQLTTLSGMPSFKYLKVLVGSNYKDAKHVSRKRMVIKLLEREAIKWSEESNGWTIVIPLDEINPKSLSFAKKSSVAY